MTKAERIAAILGSPEPDQRVGQLAALLRRCYENRPASGAELEHRRQELLDQAKEPA